MITRFFDDNRTAVDPGASLEPLLPRQHVVKLQSTGLAGNCSSGTYVTIDQITVVDNPNQTIPR